MYSNRTVKYSIKAVATYILPWAPQALSAALIGTAMNVTPAQNPVAIFTDILKGILVDDKLKQKKQRCVFHSYYSY